MIPARAFGLPSASTTPNCGWWLRLRRRSAVPSSHEQPRHNNSARNSPQLGAQLNTTARPALHIGHHHHDLRWPRQRHTRPPSPLSRLSCYLILFKHTTTRPFDFDYSPFFGKNSPFPCPAICQRLLRPHGARGAPTYFYLNLADDLFY